MPAMRSTMLILLIAALSATSAYGHAGHFHICPDTPSGQNYVRQLVGRCSSFTNANSSAGVVVQGEVLVWVYAYRNNTQQLSSALEVNVNMTDSNGQALVNQTTTGYAHTGSCAAPGSYYYDNITAGADDENMIFWTPTSASPSGNLCGNAANAFLIRTVDSNGAAEANPLRSLVIYTNTSGAVACCDFTMSPKPSDAVIASQLAALLPPSPAPAPAPSPVPSPGGAATPARALPAAAVGALLLAVALLL